MLHLAAGPRHADSAHRLGRDETRLLRAQMSALPAPSPTEPPRDMAARARRFCAKHEAVTLPADDHCDVAPASADQTALLPVAAIVADIDIHSGRRTTPSPHWARRRCPWPGQR